MQRVPVSNSFVKLKLAEQRCFHTTVQVFRVLHHLCLGYLKNWFVYCNVHNDNNDDDGGDDGADKNDNDDEIGITMKNGGVKDGK